MLKTVFSLKIVWIGAALTGFLLGVGIWGVSEETSKSNTFAVFCLVLGIAALFITLYELVKRIKGRRTIRRSPDYQAIAADFAHAQRLMEGKVFVGKSWLFSVYAAIIVRCEEVTNIREKVSTPPRGTPTAKATADVGEKESVTLARYHYNTMTKKEAERLALLLKQSRTQDHDPNAPG